MSDEGKSESASAVRSKITVDSMFRVQIPIEVLGCPFWIRVLSETDTQARDEYAMLAMAQKRKALATSGSHEHTIFIASLDDEPEENLRAAILAADAVEWTRQAQAEITARLIPFPDDADDDDKTRVLQEREDEAKRVQQARMDYVTARVKERKEVVDKMGRADLLYTLRRKQVDAQGRAAMSRAFINYTLYAALFKDAECKTRAFETPDQVSDMPEAMRDQVSDSYFAELDRVTPEDLKYFFSTAGSPVTSPPATPSASQANGESPRAASPGGGRKRR